MKGAPKDLKRSSPTAASTPSPRRARRGAAPAARPPPPARRRRRAVTQARAGRDDNLSRQNGTGAPSKRNRFHSNGVAFRYSGWWGIDTRSSNACNKSFRRRNKPFKCRNKSCKKKQIPSKRQGQLVPSSVRSDFRAEAPAHTTPPPPTHCPRSPTHTFPEPPAHTTPAHPFPETAHPHIPRTARGAPC